MNANDRAWVATRKGLFELRRRPATSSTPAHWANARVSFLGEPVSMVLPPDASGHMLAALNLGHFGVKVHASGDAGATWAEVATPTYPEQPPGAEGPAWKLVQIWSLERSVGGSGRGTTVWAGTLPGGLFRSQDGGQSWQLVDSLWQRAERLQWMGGGYDVPGIHSLLPHPRNAGELHLAISCGGVWATEDDGATWALRASGLRADFMPPELAHNPNIQDAHLVVRCQAEPHKLWCQHHGGIWRSVDNAASWQEVTGAPLSSFGFTVAVHPEHGDTAWFVPGVADMQRLPVGAALAVNRTRDGGRSFQTLREGLPQQDCYDLVYRHGLALGRDGQTLVMGTTTGNLYASSDGGDLWQAVNLHLPPIAAVRLG
jgi:hypothetical protein